MQAALTAKVIFRTQLHPERTHDPIDYPVNLTTAQIHDDIIVRLEHKYWFGGQNMFAFFDEQEREFISPRPDRYLLGGHVYAVSVTYK